MQTGELRNRITIQRQTLGTPSAISNEQLPVWTPIKEVSANIQPLRTEEMAFAKSYASEANHRITIRYDRMIELADPATIRAVFRQQLFHVTGMLNGEMNNRDNDFRNVWLTLFCVRVIDPTAFSVPTAGVVIVNT